MSRDVEFEAFALGLAPATLKEQRILARSLAKLVKLQGASITFLQGTRNVRRAPRNILITPKANVRLTSSVAWECARQLERSTGVRYAEPLFRTPGLEPDPRRLDQLLAPHERRLSRKSVSNDQPLPCAASNTTWSMELVRAPLAWAVAPPSDGERYGAGIVVGHPDTGYRPHEEIWSTDPKTRRVLPGYGHDFVDNDPEPLDPLIGRNPGHGTATASVIMSGFPDPKPRHVVGTAPLAELIPLRVSGSVVHFSFKHLTEALYFAADRTDAMVISMSLGGPFYSRALEEAVNHALARGLILLAAAGNVWPSVVYPARLDQVIAVAACNCASKPWRNSAHGETVDLSAPGESVWRANTTQKNGTVNFSVDPSSGTSYAVATTAGACAVWLAFHGRASLVVRYGADRLAGVFRTLLTTQGVSRPSGWNTKQYGSGILDMPRLLSAPLPPAAKLRKSALFPKRTRDETTLDRIAAYFPELTRTQVRRVFAQFFAPAVKGKARGKAVEILGPELVFHIATNAKLRARFHAQALIPKHKAKTRYASPFSVIAGSASPTLRRALRTYGPS